MCHSRPPNRIHRGNLLLRTRRSSGQMCDLGVRCPFTGSLLLNPPSLPPSLTLLSNPSKSELTFTASAFNCVGNQMPGDVAKPGFDASTHDWPEGWNDQARSFKCSGT